METERVYFAVPTHYTIGTEFDTFAEAEEFALSKIKRIDGIDEERFTRAFVDVRAVTKTEFSTEDKTVHRAEVYLTEEGKLRARGTQESLA